MDDLKNVRKRIKNRRFDGNEKPHSPISLFRIVYHLVMLVMCACVVVLALLVNQKLNLVEMPSVITNFKVEDLGSWLPFENWFSLKDEAVSATPSYTLLKDDHYTNGTNTANAASDGVILHIQKNKDGKSSISMKQDNGIVATYANLDEVTMKQDERVLKGTAMGTYTSYVTLTFLKDNQKISLDDALSQANP